MKHLRNIVLMLSLFAILFGSSVVANAAPSSAATESPVAAETSAYCPQQSKVAGYVNFNSTAYYAKVRLLKQDGSGHYLTQYTRQMEASGRYPAFYSLPCGNYMVAFDFIRRADNVRYVRSAGSFYLTGYSDSQKWVEYYW